MSESRFAKECLEGFGCTDIGLHCIDHRGAAMKRRGFVSLAAAAFLVFLRDVAQAFCNPSLVRLLGEVRQLVQARPGKGPSLGHYFIQWYGHSSFLIHSGSQTKVVADSKFNYTPAVQAARVTVINE